MAFSETQRLTWDSGSRSEIVCRTEVTPEASSCRICSALKPNSSRSSPAEERPCQSNTVNPRNSLTVADSDLLIYILWDNRQFLLVITHSTLKLYHRISCTVLWPTSPLSLSFPLSLCMKIICKHSTFHLKKNKKNPEWVVTILLISKAIVFCILHVTFLKRVQTKF